MSSKQKFDLITASARFFTLVQASSDSVDNVRKLLIEAAEWMQEKGINQWRPEQFTEDEVRSYFSRRIVYIAFDGEKPAGMFTLQSSDPGYWKSMDDPNYYYLHRLTVSVPYRHCGLGQSFLDWTMDKTVKDGKKGLRLDCRRNNEVLNLYYQNQGFAYMGISEQQDHFANLYERPVPVTTEQDTRRDACTTKKAGSL
ncbi:GNAT family N-acetyltransferase [Paenibacillus physcomitrellae]|uniref:N-acetyltransferase n=1 Tax=Paenibacillus physcomitrellae TaxID=1619311 RepID=A0ABQ1FQ92_9BACL|nr:GNAT family N-acetyltransferase [Paenibacillus physcomitrellae]GGA25210.1 N-acetyltransferase [Paenibacillus physcomitrellae]